MTRRDRRKWERRFHDLAVKEAISTITPAERHKLERIDDLLRPDSTKEERAYRVRQDYELKMNLRKIGAYFCQPTKDQP